ncbi:transmembrane protein 241-like [Mya arenaria]|uniref:transmembrane protein 241-like n=1 Tax=Mya arenaria TaxID=6604 RepID=UPI0022E080C8|nr:transmembrane protein 241-like [Mya arenaria]XP_052817110.1 transmembrane protein 241-like [Mya arenaria]XP_052817111.1 transmembrane protein 241-like [Mya arenaria]
MKQQYQLAAVYCLLFIATQFVNKYVLTVLGFQFPTIFQGWQTLVGFLMLSLLVTARHVPPLMENITRYDVANWLPGMLLFVGSIYSGSKALAKLPMPVFLSLHNLITVILCTGQLALYRQLTSLYSYAMMMILVITSILIGVSDPDFNTDGYYWMCVHVLTTGGLSIFSKLARSRLKLSAHEKLYCNYLYSVIVLAPSSYFLGDAIKAGAYPYLFYSKFYMGCIMSGIFGVFLSLNNIKLMEFKLDKADLSKIAGIAKLLTSVCSLLFFDMTLTANNVLWLSINHLAAIVCEDSSNVEESPTVPTDGQLVQQNSNTREYIRINVT